MSIGQVGGGKRTNWLLIKHRDEAAHEGDDDALLERTAVGRLGPHPEGDRASAPARRRRPS